jgi:hypothetical protein
VRPPKTFKLGTTVAIVSAAACCWWATSPAFAADTGNESITSPVSVPAGTTLGTIPYDVPECSTTSQVSSGLCPGINTPEDSLIVINGSGWSPGVNVYAMVCDGKTPTSAGYAPDADCDSLTQPSGVVVTSTGTITFNGSNSNFEVGMFRGQSPNDLFNCLATDDSPTGSTTSDGSGQTIDPTVASYGSSLALSSAGGSTAPCNIRVAYTSSAAPAIDASSDKFIPTVDSPTAPVTATPESPLPILLPTGAVVVLGVGGFLAYRKRRRSAAVAA